MEKKVCESKTPITDLNMLINQMSYAFNACEKVSQNSHRIIHTAKEPFECDVCKETFSQEVVLKRHMKIHALGECYICKRKFSQQIGLKTHMRTHTSEKPFECNICKKQFSRAFHLKTHNMSMHTGEKPYECDICKRRFSQAINMKAHMRIHASEKPYECNICKRKFYHPSSLKAHMRRHTGEKPFECNICQRKCYRRSSLRVHMRIHTGEKPYECDICKRKFSFQSSLKAHIGTHTGPYECNICKRKFSQPSSLKAHMRTHTGEKPFECNICKKKFSRACHMKAHRMRVHTGEKPFECNICQKKFSQAYNMRAHMRIHTGELGKSRDKVVVSSGSLEGNEVTPRPSKEENAVSCTFEERFGAFDSNNCSDHRGEFCDDSEEYVDEFVGNDCQVEKRKINAYECKYCGERFEGLGCKNIQCVMTSGVTNEDTKDCDPLETNSEDSLQDLSVKEEIDIHEIPFEDLASEEYKNYNFKVEIGTSFDDSEIIQTI